ncbi:hypothetical protein TNCV_4818021 [Trichonephila clavipes]|nr:hypothetical protein TNCV_4818021 [Trichonephila clavipes]
MHPPLLGTELAGVKKSKVGTGCFSDIVATLLDGGQIAHSEFKLPIDIHKKPDAICNIQTSGMATVFQRRSPIIRGYVKSLVYADKPQTLDHLEDNIRRVIADIRPQMLEKVIENWTSRLDYIRASRGSPMPEIIFKIMVIVKQITTDLNRRSSESISKYLPYYRPNRLRKLMTDLKAVCGKTNKMSQIRSCTQAFDAEQSVESNGVRGIHFTPHRAITSRNLDDMSWGYGYFQHNESCHSTDTVQL